ncbi:MAG: DUF192 domain-containing protein [Candidatus Nanoarchaeia archaeon]|nr:DUF192 domain-containing protein [Candidatus Nanoarchaeia archaeon]
MKVYLKSKEININVKKTSLFGMARGLMFRTRETDSLLFEFKFPTRMRFHSFFVFFDFLIIWLDEKNNVLDYKVCKPFMPGIPTEKPFKKVIEVPLNRNNLKIVRFFDGKRNI